MTKKEKEEIRTMYMMADYEPTDEERMWHNYCMDNDIRISFGGINKIPHKWRIAIYSNGKWVNSPNIYDRDTVYPCFFEFCKFYYEKGTSKLQEDKV